MKRPTGADPRVWNDMVTTAARAAVADAERRPLETLNASVLAAMVETLAASVRDLLDVVEEKGTGR